MLRAIAALASAAAARASCACRPLYGSRPFGPIAQPDFVNAVAGLLTQLSARELLQELRALERRFGRPARASAGDRACIDLDLLVYGA